MSDCPRCIGGFIYPETFRSNGHSQVDWVCLNCGYRDYSKIIYIPEPELDWHTPIPPKYLCPKCHKLSMVRGGHQTKTGIPKQRYLCNLCNYKTIYLSPKPIIRLPLLCPTCGKQHIVRDGFRHNKNETIQRYLCMECYTITFSPIPLPDSKIPASVTTSTHDDYE